MKKKKEKRKRKLTSIFVHHSRRGNRKMVQDHNISFQYLLKIRQLIEDLHESIFHPFKRKKKKEKKEISL